MFIPAAFAQTASKTVNQVSEQTSSQIGNLITQVITQIPLWLTALLVLVLTFGVSRIVKSLVENKLAEKGVEEEHKEVQIVAGRISSIGVITIGVTIALSIVGIDLKPIVAAGAFGVGFASQDLIMNFMAGMMILISRHYTIGDIIKVDGVMGKIEEIQMRATIIKAFDGTKIVVPNSVLFKNTVISKTSNPFRRLTFSMGVGYEADLRRVLDLTLEVVKQVPHITKKPKPSVVLTEWGDSTINFLIHVWIESRGGKAIKVKNQVIMRLTKAYNQAGVNIPYPIQTINFEGNYDENETKNKTDQLIAQLKTKRQEREAKALAATNANAALGSEAAPNWLANALQQQVNQVKQFAGQGMASAQQGVQNLQQTASQGLIELQQAAQQVQNISMAPAPLPTAPVMVAIEQPPTTTFPQTAVAPAPEIAFSTLTTTTNSDIANVVPNTVQNPGNTI